MKNLLRSCALVALLGLASASQLLAATYFVNPNGGNDSYNGAAPALTSGSNGPWQTLAKLAAVTLAPNDTVYLACGGVWNETLKVSSSGAVNVPITITAGPGSCATPPLIDGAVTIPAHQWVQHSGSIYKAKLPIDLIANPNPGASLAGWTHWSSGGAASIAADNACPGQATPCMAFTSGGGNSIAISNSFAISGGVEYTAGVQLWAAAGTAIKVVLRRAGPTYEKLAPDQWITSAGAWQSVGFVFRAATSVPNARLDIEVAAAGIRLNLREAHVRRALPGADVIATFVDGLNVRRAHHPNFGYAGVADSPYAAVASAGGKTTLDVAGLSLPSGAALTTALGATVRTINWAIEERAISAVAGTRLTLSSPTRYDILPGYGFYLTGALWMLDSPGEWFFDAVSSVLYVWMPDGSTPGNRVAAGGLALGADLTSKAHVALSKIAVRHVGSGVSLAGGTKLDVAAVAISDTADHGVNAFNCVGCAVTGSDLARTGLDAVTAAGGRTTGFVLMDSTIADSGASVRTDGWRYLPRSAEGAVNSTGPSANIARNRIVGSAKLGVHVGPSSQVVDNYVALSCLTLNDCGAIYAGRTGSNATISGNVVEGVIGNITGMPGAPQPRTVGIYLDDLNANSVVSGNTVTGAEYGIQLHNASGAAISNNVLFGNRRHQLWFHENTNDVRPAGDIAGNNVAANLMVPTASGPALYLISELGDTTDFATFSGNHYSALLSQRVLGEVTPTSGSSFTVAEWLAAGRETAPGVTQPVGYASFLAGATNRVPNGGLTNGITGWTWWSLTAPKATAIATNCGFAPCLTMAAGATASLLSSPNFAVSAGQLYRVTFDAVTSQDGQPINVVVRRGGGGSAGYEYLMPAAESFVGSKAWRRYSFTFQANKTVTPGDPVTQELGARVDFERNLPGTAITIAWLEMVTLQPAQAALQIKLLVNKTRSASNLDCSSTGVALAVCDSFVYFADGGPVGWPVAVPALSGIPIYTRDTSLTDTDQDGIADQQDACPGTISGMPVNARGCAFGQ